MRLGKLLQCIKCGGSSFTFKIFHDFLVLRRAQDLLLTEESSIYLLVKVLRRSDESNLFGPTRSSSDTTFVPSWLHFHQDGKAPVTLISSDKKRYPNWAPGPTYGVGLSHLDVRRGTRVWSPKLTLDGAAIPHDASLRNYAGGKAGRIAEALEQALLLRKDMESYRRFSQQELFLSLKRDLAMIAQQIYVAEEWNNEKDVEVQAHVRSREEVEKALGKARDECARISKQLKKEAKAKRNVEAGLKNVEKQAEDQRQKLYTTEINLETERALVKELRAELDKAKDAAKLAKEDAQLAKEAIEAEKQAAYLLGVQETQTRLTEEFAKVCRDYCDITWGKGLDAAGVPAESALRQPGSVYYHPDICNLLDTLEASSAGQNLPVPNETGQTPLQTGDAGDLPKTDPVP